MKPVLIAATALALLTFVPTPAAAQQTSALVIALTPPETALTEGATLSFEGTATYTADWTAVLGLMGIPVTYSVTEQPEWATVSISPASDVFPLPSGPTSGPSYTVTRVFTVTVTLAEDPEADVTGLVEIVGTTSPGMLGRAAMGKATTPIVFDAPEEPCPEHALTQAQLAAYAEQASEAFAEYEASKAEEDPEVTVQNSGATPLSLPWAAVAGCALAGAGVGLLLRRRLKP